MKFENISNHKYTTIKNAPTIYIYIIQLLHLSHTIPSDSVFAVTLGFADFHH